MKLSRNTCCGLYLSLTVVIALSACGVKWTEALSYGSIGITEFSESVDFTIESGLIFAPVRIKGETYRFLLDSGAPFSVSEELQNRFMYKVVSTGNIVDSDRNKNSVDYVQVDTIHIGSIAFIEQTAFVGDFKANPILECLHIDGIIGSNLMRHCNWIIDQDNNVLTLASMVDDRVKESAEVVPFRADNQFDIMMDIDAGQSTLKNIKLDYGSNGAISIPEKLFNLLDEKEEFKEVMVDRGVKQTGLVGKPVPINRKSVIVDSVGFGAMRLNNVELRTGKSSLLGNQILSSYLVSIDWNTKQLYFKKYDTKTTPKRTFGFSMGFTKKKGMYVQSVRDNSNAYHQGIVPNMLVQKVDSLDFIEKNNFCDYINFMDTAPDTIHVTLLDAEGITRQYKVGAIPLLSK